MSEVTVVADENLHSRIIVGLRVSGIDVYSVRENSPGITDRQVLDLSVAREAVLITEDADFGALVFSHPHADSNQNPALNLSVDA